MARAYSRQTEPRPQEQWYDQERLNYLNENSLHLLLTELGINVTKAGDKVPESGGVPRIFLMDEKGGQPRSLADEGVETGSVQFWELARQGRMFAYAAGQKEPVQLQIEGEYPPSLHFSAPLSTAAQVYEDKPSLRTMPKEVKRPGWFSRLMNSINSNWYKAENDAYRTYVQKSEEIRAFNAEKLRTHEEAARKSREALEGPCAAVRAIAQSAFGEKREKQEDLDAELVSQELDNDAYEQRRAAQARETAADKAEAKEDVCEDAVLNVMSMYGPKPVALEHLVSGRRYSADSIKKIKPLEIPEGMKIGAVPVDDRLFANLALNAQLTPAVSRPDFERKCRDGCARLRQEGLSEREIDRVACVVTGGMNVTDPLQTMPRVGFDQFFEYGTIPARDQALEALQKYQAGDVKPLAEIIASAVTMTVCCAKEGLTGEGPLAHAKLTCELLDLLEQKEQPAQPGQPTKTELLAQAVQEAGVKGKDIKACRGMDQVRILHDSALLAASKIARAAVAPDDPLSELEKTAYMSDIVRFETVKTMMAKQADDANFADYVKANDELEKRMTATETARASGKPMPEGVKPLEADLRGFLPEKLKLEMKAVPSIVRQLQVYAHAAEVEKRAGVEPDPTALDKLVDMTVRGMGYARMDSRELAEKHIGGNALTGDALILAQDRIAKAKDGPEPAAVEKESVLDATVDYGKGGPAV